MSSQRYSRSRQKACHSCVKAKVRCDRAIEGCRSCQQRGKSCIYAQDPSPSRSTIDISNNQDTLPKNSHADSMSKVFRSSAVPENGRVIDSAGNLGYPYMESAPRIEHRVDNTSSEVAIKPLSYAKTEDSDSDNIAIDMSGHNLLCPINADDIQNRWLKSFIPTPGQRTKYYPPAVIFFIHRMLKSYAGRSVHGNGAGPFVHWVQLSTANIRLPLSVCLSVVRICDNSLPRANAFTTNILHTEIKGLYDKAATFDEVDLLAVFQAYLIYAMVLKFWQNEESSTLMTQIVMNLQELACNTSRQGLVCLNEPQGVRPCWEAWIQAESKRRSLYTMYLFDNLLSAQDGLPTFLGSELEGLPAPASKGLWQAKSRTEWERAYNAHLTIFGDGGLRIEELWATSSTVNAVDLAERRRRVDLWLEGIDEFGTMLYAVTSGTHGG